MPDVDHFRDMYNVRVEINDIEDLDERTREAERFFSRMNMQHSRRKDEGPKRFNKYVKELKGKDLQALKKGESILKIDRPPFSNYDFIISARMLDENIILIVSASIVKLRSSPVFSSSAILSPSFVSSSEPQ